MKIRPGQNIYAIDQEDGGLVWASDDRARNDFDAGKFLSQLEPGGGIVVGDGNSWGIRNETSLSQFAWQTDVDRNEFQRRLREQGYTAITVANKLANTVIHRYGAAPSDAVIALWRYASDQVRATGRFDSGHEVRPYRVPDGDISFGQRINVVRDFLRFQNSGGYDSPFAEDIVQIAFDALAKGDRELFDLKKTMPKVGSLRRIAAVAVCVYEPYTGQLRTYRDRPWGVRFIVRNVIGLNGTMTGRGPKAPGNPMRAALRCVGRRYGEKVNREERARFDRLVRDLIRAFQAHGPVRAA